VHPEVDALAPIADRLGQRYAGTIPSDVIRTVLDETFQELESTARITAYLLLLAERCASRRLADMAGDAGVDPEDVRA
jgi:hypothetical protein